MPAAVELTWADQRLTLLAERAVLWHAPRHSAASSASTTARRRTLIIADPHFGKAAAFRSFGVPVPPGSTTAGLQRLSAALQTARAERLVILGDFFHARRGRADRTLAAIGAWRATWPELEIILIRGNHDAGSGDPPPEWHITCVPEPWTAGPLCFRHALPDVTDFCESPTNGCPTLAGHIHPVINLADALGTSLRAPCFIFGRDVAILPAFGAFTGGHPIRPRPGNRVFAVGDGEVVEVSVPGR